MGKTVLLAKTEPGSAPGVNWEVGGEDGAQEVETRYADHLLGITGNDFFVVQPKEKKAEKPAKTEEPVKPESKVAKKKPEPATDDDLTEALKVANSNTQQSKE
jgi:hypothetical protein